MSARENHARWRAVDAPPVRSGLALAVVLSGCGLVYDLDPRPDASGLDATVRPPADAASPDAGDPGADGQVVADASECAPEVCNGADDDCDSIVDECDVSNGTGMCGDAGTCEIVACVDPYADCNGRVDDGCEADLQSDSTHCGSCERACPGIACVLGECKDPYVEITAGDAHTCAITASGALYCWGHNEEGELGLGLRTAEVLRPVRVGGISGVSIAEAADHFTCAATPAGVYCWGDGRGGRLGNGGTTGLRAPAATPAFNGRVLGMSAGFGSVVVTTPMTGETRGWGDNSGGQLGLGTDVPDPVLSPTARSVVSNAGQITLGSGFACAVVSPGAQCWGLNGSYQLGRGSAVSVPSEAHVPAAVTSLDPTDPVVQVSAGQAHACARTTAGAVYCGGDNLAYQSSEAADTDPAIAEPSSIALPAPATDVSAGGNTSCAIAAGQVWCWGSNAAGQVGIGSSRTRVLGASPVTGIRGALSVDVGRYHACAITDRDEAYCWGDGSRGQLGTGSSETLRRSPVLVAPRREAS